MAVKTVTSAQIIAGGADISSFTGSITEVPGTRTLRDAQNFASRGFKVHRLGIRAGAFGLAGQAWNDADTDLSATITPATLGDTQDVSLAVPASGADVVAGDWCQFGVGRLQSWSRPLAIDELGMFAASWATSEPFAIGKVAAPLATVTTSGLTGTAIALTGPAAGQRLYALLQVTAATGTDLAVTIQSDDNSSFTSATTRITFATVSAVGYQLLSVAGDLSTETHWRVVATVASDDFDLAVQIGVA